MKPAVVLIIVAALCFLIVVGGTIGLYFSKTLCPDFGSKCPESPASAPSPAFRPPPASAPSPAVRPPPASAPTPASAPITASAPTPASAPITAPVTYAGFVPGASGGGIVGIGVGGSGGGSVVGPCASAGTACRPFPNDVCAEGFTPSRDGNNKKISGANAIKPGMCSACCSKTGDGIDFTGRSPYNDPSSGNPYSCTYQHCRP